MHVIIISACIYLSAFLYPNYLWVAVFLWMLPLIVTDKETNCGFIAGFIWGLIFFSGHLAWFASFTYEIGSYVYVATVCYFALFSGFWLWLQQLLVFRWVSKFTNLNRKCAALCCTWIISTVIFFYLTCYCSLAIFDCFEGYTFLNPLLPLVSWSWYLRPIYYFGMIWYWINIVAINLTIASLYIKFNGKTLIFLLAFIALQSQFQPSVEKIKLNKSDFFYIQPSWNNYEYTVAQQFYAISKELDIISGQCKGVRYIVLPEGSFAHDLMVWENKLEAWTSLLPVSTSIFIGAYRKDASGLYNSLFQIRDGKIIAWYDKQHLVCCMERKPYIIKYIPCIEKLFLGDCFSYPIENQSMICIEGFRPMICSELFSERIGLSMYDKPILFICNDACFCMPYAQDLAKRYTQLLSWRYQMQIIYVGYYGSYFFI